MNNDDVDSEFRSLPVEIAISFFVEIVKHDRLI